EALAQEKLRLDLNARLVARLPAAAMNPDDYGQALCLRRRIHVEHLALVRRLGIEDVALDVLGPRVGQQDEGDEKIADVLHGSPPISGKCERRAYAPPVAAASFSSAASFS